LAQQQFTPAERRLVATTPAHPCTLEKASRMFHKTRAANSRDVGYNKKRAFGKQHSEVDQ
jgi:hypothetical protein